MNLNADSREDNRKLYAKALNKVIHLDELSNCAHQTMSLLQINDKGWSLPTSDFEHLCSIGCGEIFDFTKPYPEGAFVPDDPELSIDHLYNDFTKYISVEEIEQIVYAERLYYDLPEVYTIPVPLFHLRQDWSTNAQLRDRRVDLSTRQQL